TYYIKYSNLMSKENLEDIIYKNGLFAPTCPIENEPNKNRVAETTLLNDIVEVSDNFKFQFYNSGIMRNGKVLTIDTIAQYEKSLTLNDIIEDDVDES